MKQRVAFVALAIVLIGVSYARADDVQQQSLREFVLATRTKQAYGIYLGEKKIGWILEEMKLGEYDGQEVGVVTEEGIMSMKLGDVEHVTKFKNVTMHSLEGEGLIVFAEEQTDDDGVLHRFTATRDNDGLLIKSQIGDRKSTRRVPLSKSTLDDARAMYRWFQTPPQPNDTFESYSFSLDEDETDSLEKVTYSGSKTIQWAGVATKVYQVSIDDGGLVTQLDVKADMRPLRGSMGPFELRAEELATAQKLDAAVLDMFVNLPVNKRMGDPTKVRSMTVELSGLGDFQFPQSHRQNVQSREEGKVVLVVRRDYRPADAEPLTDEQREKYLKATPRFQVDHKKIQRLAKRIVGDEKDPIKASALLQAWVYKKLDKRSDANASTALHVLDQKAGDCTEHSMLFVALARAAGIPARDVGGLGYAELAQPIFAWHAWAQIHDGHAWISVDPTWDEVFVDATHILFQDQEDDWSWINVLGNVKLKIVDHESDE